MFTQVAITGTVVLSNSTDASGATVSFTLNTPITDGSQLVAPETLTARCNASGAFSITLNANDDSSTIPTGTYYQVTIGYGEQTLDSFNVIVPHADAPTVNLFTLAQLTNPNVQIPYVISVNGQNGTVITPGLPPAAAVATANVTSLSGLNTYDGYALATADVVLLTAQTTASQNGPWVAASGTWSRPAWFSTGSSVKAHTIAIINGSTYGKSIWLLQTNTALTVDTNSQTWGQASSSGGSGGSPFGAPAEPGSLGATQTINFGSPSSPIWKDLIGTLSANLTVTASNFASAPGCRGMVIVTQPSSGSPFTLSMNDGSGAVTANISQALGSTSFVYFVLDGSNEWFQVLSPSGASALTPTAIIDATSSPYAVAAGGEVLVDLSQGNLTLKAPNAPSDQSQWGWKVVYTGVTTTLTTALSTGGPITSLPTAGGSALRKAIPAGATVITQSGANSQSWVVAAGGAATGATSIPVNSQTANFAYPIGSTVTYSPSYALTVQTQGSDVFEVAGGATTSTPPIVLSQAKRYQYEASTLAHVALDGDTPLSQLDTRYFHSGPGWIDMCATPYNCTPGTDITSAFQTAINLANVLNQDTTLYFSKPGVYNINGSLQSGTALTYSYNGQVLFPARLYSQGPIQVRIMGVNPVANEADGTPGTEPMPVGGVVLQSNATAGWVFDAIPANNSFTDIMTDIGVTFENIRVTVPGNPQCGGINGLALRSLRFAGSCSVDTTNPNQALTGAGIGVQMPAYNNMAISRMDGDVEVLGFPVGVAHSEHFTAENLYVGYCLTAVQPQAAGGIGHTSLYKRLLIQGCRYVFAPGGANAAQIRGLIDIGDIAGGTYALWGVANDPNNLLYGEITVGQWVSGTTTLPIAPGFPVIGALNLTFVPYVGRRSEWPSDDFTRISTGVTNYIGTTANTHHIWSSATTQWSTAGGVLKATQNAGQTALIKYQQSRAGASRVVRGAVNLSGAYSVAMIVGKPVSGANNYLELYMSSAAQGGNANAVGLYKVINGVSTLLAVTGAAAVSAAAHTIDIIVSNPVGGPEVISIVVDGVIQPLTLGAGAGALVTVQGVANGGYQLAAAEVAQFVDADHLHTQDGVSFSNDQASSFSYFAVMQN